MSCFNPNQGIRLDSGAVKFIGSVRSNIARGTNLTGLNVFPMPCGKCVGCRLSYSKGWAVRNCHEAQYHESMDMPSLFVTLTYNDEFNARNGGSLNYRDCQLFLKRLRFAMSDNYSDYAFTSVQDMPLRFYMCGEYGGKTFRPHYHFLLYNLGFHDEKLYKVTSTGHKLFNSDSLSSFWSDPDTGESMGYVVHGDVTVGSAGYVSRYCTKKHDPSYGLPVYNRDTGKFLVPEFTQMSRRPGIAYEWFKRYGLGVYPDDKVVMGNGLFYKPPRYYDIQLEKADPVLFESVKQARIEFANSPLSLANNTLERLEVRETIQLSKLRQLPRHL